MAMKMTKERKEAEFLLALEMILGGELLPWQREIVCAVREDSLRGKPVDFDLLRAVIVGAKPK